MTVSIERLSDDLRTLGVAPGRLLMIHASLRAIGAAENGAAGVVSALEQAVGARGTLLMVLGAADAFAWVNERAEIEREALLEGSPAFDPLRTPAEPEVGVLAEVFRLLPGTVVSDHPEGRFGARGHDARALVESQPWDDYYGPGSPLERFIEADGYLLRMGADPDTTTLLHYAEYLADVPNKRRVRRHRVVQGPAGREIRVVSCLNDSQGIVEYAGEDYFSVILNEYLKEGRHRVGMIGGARSELIPATDLLGFAVPWMNQHLK